MQPGEHDVDAGALPPASAASGSTLMRKAILLLSLSGLGTGCAFAALGATLFARVLEPAVFTWIFFAFGAAGGLGCTALRLGMVHLAAQAAAAGVQAALKPAPRPAQQAARAAASPALPERPAMPAPAPSTWVREPLGVAAAGFASSAFGAL